MIFNENKKLNAKTTYLQIFLCRMRRIQIFHGIFSIFADENSFILAVNSANVSYT